MRRSIKKYSATGVSVIALTVLAGGSAMARGAEMRSEENQTFEMSQTNGTKSSVRTRTRVRVAEDSSIHVTSRDVVENGHSNDEIDTGEEREEIYDMSMQQYELDVALREHAILAVNLLKAQHLDQPGVAALEAAVEANNQVIADAVNQLHPDTEGRFMELWRRHIEDYQQYLSATEQEDTAGRQQALRSLDAFSADMAALLSDDVSRSDRTNIEAQLDAHVQQTTSAIDTLVVGDYETFYRLAHQGYEYMGIVAESMVGDTIDTRHRGDLRARWRARVDYHDHYNRTERD